MARKVGLDRRQVLDEAAALADAHGIESVTLARVASALGVASPSLYTHVASLQALRRELALVASTRLAATLRDAIAGEQGVAAVRATARAYRAFAHEHPGLYSTLHSTPGRGEDPEVYAAFAAVLPDLAAVLRGLGLPDDDTVPLLRAVRSALHGFASLEASGGFGLPEDVDASFETLVDVLVAGMLARG
ncbi:MAG: WHG domain-containing protein [Nocardioides sp.]